MTSKPLTATSPAATANVGGRSSYSALRPVNAPAAPLQQQTNYSQLRPTPGAAGAPSHYTIAEPADYNSPFRPDLASIETFSSDEDEATPPPARGGATPSSNQPSVSRLTIRDRTYASVDGEAAERMRLLESYYRNMRSRVGSAPVRGGVAATESSRVRRMTDSELNGLRAAAQTKRALVTVRRAELANYGTLLAADPERRAKLEREVATLETQAQALESSLEAQERSRAAASAPPPALSL